MTNNDVEIVSAPIGQALQVTVSIPADKLEEVFKEEYDGWCLVCLNTLINVGEIICDTCLNDAMTYRGGALCTVATCTSRRPQP